MSCAFVRVARKAPLFTALVALVACRHSAEALASARPTADGVATTSSPVRQAASPEHAWICVSNEGSGDVTLIDASSHAVVATIPVGKRPRGIHASPDGKLLYVALTGSPSEGPPELDAKGNPILRHVEDEERDAQADGIGVIDLERRELVKKIPAGSDPEQFAISADGRHLFVANEDVGTASVVDTLSGKVEDIVRVHKEPEGVGITPDGRRVFVTCETGGEVVVFDAATHATIGEVALGGRPRSIVFLQDGERACVPSETAGVVHVVDTEHLAEIATIALPKGSRPMGTALSRDGRRLFTGNGRAGTVSIIDVPTSAVVGNVTVGKRAWGVALSLDERTLYVANGPSDDVSVVDVAGAREVEKIHAGKGPWGIAVVGAPLSREKEDKQ
jgi:YVTN family beta-propeller protein